MDSQIFWSFPTEDLIMFAESVRYLIIKAGGMARKGLVEAVIMDRFGLDQENAHTLTNLAEAANKHFFTLNPVQWVSDRWPEPQVEDWPYLANYSPTISVNPNEKGHIFRLSRKFEVIRLSYRVNLLDPHIAKEIADSFYFLVPPNTAFSASQLAEAMDTYSIYPRVAMLVQILMDLEAKKYDGN